MCNEAFGIQLTSACFLVSTKVAEDGSWRGGYRATQLVKLEGFPPGNDIIIDSICSILSMT